MRERKNIFRWMLTTLAIFMIIMAGNALADETIHLGALASGQMIRKDGVENKGAIYFSFSVPAAGILNVNGYRNNVGDQNEAFGLKITLCNAYGAPIDYKEYEYPNSMSDSKDAEDVIYGIKAGTYMIRIEPFSENEYHLAVMFTQKKNLAKYSKRKALNMKRGKKYSIVLPAGEKRAVWLKLTVPGNRKINVMITAMGQGDSIVRFSGNKLKGNGTISRNLTNKWKLYSRTGLRETALRKGTYYIKISRNINKGYSNGWLQVSWK